MSLAMAEPRIRDVERLLTRKEAAKYFKFKHGLPELTVDRLGRMAYSGNGPKIIPHDGRPKYRMADLDVFAETFAKRPKRHRPAPSGVEPESSPSGDDTRIAYSLNEVVRLTGVGRSFLYACMKDGRLKARSFGRRTIVLHDDLMNFVGSFEQWRPLENRAEQS